MCDFSILAAKTRDAEVGDKLVTQNFGHGTSGFTAEDGGPELAICVRPGTEIAFDEAPALRYQFVPEDIGKLARFRQVNVDQPAMHHDALEFANGQIIMLTTLAEGQRATVLQLPAKPKTEAEAKAQQRLEVVG